MFLLLSTGLLLAGKFTSLVKPMESSSVTADAVFPADGPEGIRSERQREHRDPTQKLRLPIVKSISWSRFAKTRARVGGCGQKSTVPKVIWFSPIFELLFDESKIIVKSITPTPKVPTIGAS
jgi:hypothetical protein